MKSLYPTPAPAAASKDPVEKTRRWVNANGTVVIVVTVLLVCLAMFTLKSEFASATPKDVKMWYTDIVTGEYFEADATLLPPIQSPWGNEAVRVFFYDCADCENPQPQFRIYEKYTEQAKALAGHLMAGEMPEASDLDPEMDPWEAVYGGRLLSLDGVTWFACEDEMEAEEMLGRKCGVGEVMAVPGPF